MVALKDKAPPAAAAPLPAILLDFPDRKERLECVDLYAGHWFEVVTNVPPNRARDQKLGDFLATVITAWSFKTRDGAPAPITPEALDGLPPDLWNWLVTEYYERRERPLAQRLPASPRPTA